jgi:predicted RNA binding protein YcfA (HicA-like mRNA interferase family)
MVCHQARFPSAGALILCLLIDHVWSIIVGVTGKEVIAMLKAAGWSLNRIQGSHPILTKDGQAVPVPVHGSRDLGAGLLAAIQRQTGVRLK